MKKTLRWLSVLVTSIMLVSFFVLASSAGKKAAAAEKEKEIVIGLSFPTRNSQFWQKALKFAQQCSKQLKFRLIAIDNDRLEDQQIDDVENFASMGVDAMVIRPNTEAIGPKLMEIPEKAGIPFVFIDTYPGIKPEDWHGTHYIGFIGQSNESAGRRMALELIDAGVKKMVAIGGVRGTSVADEREKGLRSVIKEQNGKVTLLAYQYGRGERRYGLDIMENYLVAHPELDGVWCYNDDQAMGVLKALKNAGRLGKIPVVGMDITDEAITRMEKGDYRYSIGGHWTHTGFGPLLAYDYLHGYAPKDRNMKVTFTSVNKDNVNAYIEQFIKKPLVFDFVGMSKARNPDSKYNFAIEIK